MIQHNKSPHLETDELITSCRFSAHIVVERILQVVCVCDCELLPRSSRVLVILCEGRH